MHKKAAYPKNPMASLTSFKRKNKIESGSNRQVILAISLPPKKMIAAINAKTAAVRAGNARTAVCALSCEINISNKVAKSVRLIRNDANAVFFR